MLALVEDSGVLEQADDEAVDEEDEEEDEGLEAGDPEDTNISFWAPSLKSYSRL